MVPYRGPALHPLCSLTPALDAVRWLVVSEIGKVIDLVISQAVTPIMRSDGYRKTGRTFHLAEPDHIRVVNVQASQWNFGVTGRFTVNLGVYFRPVEALLASRPLPGLPKEYQCTLRARIGSLMPDDVDWWEITTSTDIDDLAQTVAAACTTFALPWLVTFSDPTAAQARLNEMGWHQHAAAFALWAGHHDQAKEFVLRSRLDRADLHERALAWGRRHGLDV